MERHRGLRGGHQWVGQSQAGSVAHRRDCPRQAEEETRERKGLLKKANAEEEGGELSTQHGTPLCRPAFLVYRPGRMCHGPCRKPPAAAPEVLMAAAAPSAARRHKPGGEREEGTPQLCATRSHNHLKPAPTDIDSPCTVRGIQQSQRESRRRHTSPRAVRVVARTLSSPR